MDNASQKRALKAYRARLSQRGLARFEVLGRDTDRDLIRTLARRLAENDQEADRIRDVIVEATHAPRKTGGVLAALRRSPLVGSGIDLTKTRAEGREIDL